VAKLVYSVLASLDGFIEDETGAFGSAEPDEEVHRFINELERSASAEGDISVGGPGLAAHALKAGLVDECRLFIAPVIVGGGKRWLPEGLRLDLELMEERRFGNGMAYLRYGPRPYKLSAPTLLTHD
jgi:dihydrofolate reductase